MFTVAYVVVDDNSLFFYNEMMKSLTSLRMHMPNQKVSVFTDDKTYGILQNIDAEVFKVAEVVCVKIGGEYTHVEKSRYIKVTLRERVKGPLLYIDTDTVICDFLPEIEMKKSVGLVLEFHSLRTDTNWYLTDLYDERSGLNLESYDYFYNSGVIWSKDDEHAHRIYRKWHELWEQTRKNGIPRDQSPLNYVLKEERDYVETLDGVWNCQLARAFSMGLNYISKAYVIHYFNIPTSAYKFCQDEYRNLPYTDEQIIEMLRRPKEQFSKCRLVKLDDNNQIDGCNMKEIYSITNTQQFRLLEWVCRHQYLHRFIETSLSLLFKARNLFLK